MTEVNLLLDDIVTEYCKILKNNLVGIYLHGSLAMKCYNNRKSDIDFLVVVNNKPSVSDMHSLIEVLLTRQQDCPVKGFEMSVILKEDARNFKYPTPFVLHYSNYHKDRYMKDPDYICGGFEDADLAAHMMVTRERGVRLYGETIDRVFEPIPKKYYVDSIVKDVFEAKEEITSNPTYFVLNLCRVLYYLREEVISSKKEGGLWGCNNLPEDYRKIVHLALQDYEGDQEVINWETKQLLEFAEYMIDTIKTNYF